MRPTRVDHRVHGNRVMHESVVGIDSMIGESRILLYEHSARCPTAREMFLRCNPQYRSVASMGKDQQNQLRPNVDLDLYNAAIVAVRESFYSMLVFSLSCSSSLVPDHCSAMFYGVIEALFITHAQTQLNRLGHLDGMVVKDVTHLSASRRMNTRFPQ